MNRTRHSSLAPKPELARVGRVGESFIYGPCYLAEEFCPATEMRRLEPSGFSAFIMPGAKPPYSKETHNVPLIPGSRSNDSLQASRQGCQQLAGGRGRPRPTPPDTNPNDHDPGRDRRPYSMRTCVDPPRKAASWYPPQKTPCQKFLTGNPEQVSTTRHHYTFYLIICIIVAYVLT